MSASRLARLFLKSTSLAVVTELLTSEAREEREEVGFSGYSWYPYCPAELAVVATELAVVATVGLVSEDWVGPLIPMHWPRALILPLSCKTCWLWLLLMLLLLPPPPSRVGTRVGTLLPMLAAGEERAERRGVMTLIWEETSPATGNGAMPSSPVTVAAELTDCGLVSLKPKDLLLLVPSEYPARNLETTQEVKGRRHKKPYTCLIHTVPRFHG